MVNRSSPFGLQEFDGTQLALMQQHVIDTQYARLKASQQQDEINKEIQEKQQEKIQNKLIEAQQLQLKKQHQQQQQQQQEQEKQKEIHRKIEAQEHQVQQQQHEDLLDIQSSLQLNQKIEIQQKCDEQQMSEDLTAKIQSEHIDIEVNENGQESKTSIIHRCLVCNKQVWLLNSGINNGAYDLFSDQTRTRFRHFRAIEFLEGVFKEELIFAPLHSTLICKRCFKLVDEIDEIEVSLLGKREELSSLYFITKSQIIDNQKEAPEKIETVTVVTNSGGPAEEGPGRLMFDMRSGSLVMQKDEAYEEEQKLKVIHLYEDDNGINNNNNNINDDNDDDYDDAVNDNGSPDYDTDDEEVQEEQRFICRLCSGIFRTVSHLNRHLDTHKASVYHCHFCNGNFAKATDLQTHMDQHYFEENNTDKANAEQSEKNFGSNSNQIVSKKKSKKKRRAPKPRASSCPICGKIFQNRKEVQDHRRIDHRGERPFECDICGNAFSQKGSLLVHKRVNHLQEARFKCDFCDKNFKFKRHLVGHVMSVHTGERPYKCAHCDAAFAYPQHCRKHMRIHTGEKPYICNICGKSFSSSDNCNAHMFTHTNKKKFECLICSVGCMRKNQILDHIKSHGYTEDQNHYFKVNAPGNLHVEMGLLGSSRTTAAIIDQDQGENMRLTAANIAGGTKHQNKHYSRTNTQLLTTVSEIDYRGGSMPHHTIAAHVVLPASSQTATVSAVPTNMMIAPGTGHNTPHRTTGNAMEFYDMPMLFIDSENAKQVTEGGTYIVEEM